MQCMSITARNRCVEKSNAKLYEAMQKESGNDFYTLPQRVVRDMNSGFTSRPWDEATIEASAPEVRRAARLSLAWVATAFEEYWGYFSDEYLGDERHAILLANRVRPRDYRSQRSVGVRHAAPSSLEPEHTRHQAERRRRRLRLNHRRLSRNFRWRTLLASDDATDDGEALVPVWDHNYDLGGQMLSRHFPRQGYGFKNPMAMFLIPLYVRLFPQMLFIHVVRDGRDFSYGGKLMTMAKLWHRALLREDTAHDEAAWRPSEGPPREQMACDEACHDKRVLFWSVANGNATDAGERMLNETNVPELAKRYITARTEDIVASYREHDIMFHIASLVAPLIGYGPMPRYVRTYADAARTAVAPPILRGETLGNGMFDACKHYGGAKWANATSAETRERIYEVGRPAFERYNYGKAPLACSHNQGWVVFSPIATP